MNVLGKNKWGPIAWNLLHSFSINNNKIIKENYKHNYYIFYTSFEYILPCLICSTHYSDILYNKLPLSEDLITRKYIIKWVYEAHNIVNLLLGKKICSYDNCINENKNPKNKEIFFFMKAIYLNFDYNNISLYKFDQIYNFFLNFCILYPNKEIRKLLNNYIKKNNFKKIYTPIELKKWFIYNKEIWNIPEKI
jgi:hypothetical protein